MTTHQKRAYLIPFLFGAVWIASFAVSVFYDFKGVWTSSEVLVRILSFLTILLVSELLLVYWDLNLILVGYELPLEDSWKVQCRVAPFLVATLPGFAMAFRYGLIGILFFGICLMFLKIAIHHCAVYVDHAKQPVEYETIRIG